jgi:hypothetical protein
VFLVPWLFLLSLGCSSLFTHGKRKEPDTSPSVLSQKVLSRWEAQVELISLPEVSVYLQRLAQGFRIPEFQLVRVFLFKDRNTCEESCAFLDHRLYISLRMLSALKYENELAFLIALQLAHLKRGDAWKRVQVRKSLDFWGSEGVFSFSLEEEKEAIKLAIEWLYTTGFDPRGAISFLDSWKASGLCRRWNVSDWQELKQVAYQAIAAQSPLRHPMIRSEDFLFMRKHLELYQNE